MALVFGLSHETQKNLYDQSLGVFSTLRSFLTQYGKENTLAYPHQLMVIP